MTAFDYGGLVGMKTAEALRRIAAAGYSSRHCGVDPRRFEFQVEEGWVAIYCEDGEVVESGPYGNA